ncbi:hypothetical protein L211DRAFT_67933 [Terfezia boudieri ATCC MYA-4762]|uniref:Uncharacterized protein n=1 Tax=Terfezia boudieri ATCC MYA-4762 TaxID=1051890 RepID=A0A3N4LSW9_9PEZI|nr:hypothetical protein L211DRAFT_67933 [Terfezia boudieri ATCC MYA-4762]
MLILACDLIIFFYICAYFPSHKLQIYGRKFADVTGACTYFYFYVHSYLIPVYMQKYARTT